MSGFKVGERFVCQPNGMPGYVIQKISVCQVRFENKSVLLVNPKALYFKILQDSNEKPAVGDEVYLDKEKGNVVKFFEFYLCHLQDRSLAVLPPEIMMKIDKKIVSPSSKLIQPGQVN